MRKHGNERRSTGMIKSNSCSFKFIQISTKNIKVQNMKTKKYSTLNLFLDNNIIFQKLVQELGRNNICVFLYIS